VSAAWRGTITQSRPALDRFPPSTIPRAKVSLSQLDIPNRPVRSRPKSAIGRPVRQSRNRTFSVAGRRRLCAHARSSSHSRWLPGSRRIPQVPSMPQTGGFLTVACEINPPAGSSAPAGRTAPSWENCTFNDDERAPARLCCANSRAYSSASSSAFAAFRSAVAKPSVKRS
jgi:hypothetical protein